VAGAVGAQGPPGPEGPEGAQGPQGIPGTPATIPVPIAQGGTNGTTAADARTNLDVFSKGEIQGGVALTPKVVLANDAHLFGRTVAGVERQLAGLESDDTAYFASDSAVVYVGLVSTFIEMADVGAIVRVRGRLDAPQAVRAWAVVQSTGATSISSGVASVVRLSTGLYRLTLSIALTYPCATAILNGPATVGQITTSVIDPSTVDVQVRQLDAAPLDAPFSVSVMGIQA
jgi:hypothetical protein